MWILHFAAVFASTCIFSGLTEQAQDRALPAEYYRNDSHTYLWPEVKNIPFYISDGISESYSTSIQLIVYLIQRSVCLLFKQLNDSTVNETTSYIKFISVEADYCDTSHIGYNTHGPIYIRLGPSCSRKNIFRQLFHALGMFKEHQRGDRDRYIHVSYKNVMPRCRIGIDILPMDARILSEDYDYDSITHWDNYACARWSNVTTMESIEEPNRKIGVSESPTMLDYQKLSNLYCNGKKPSALINSSSLQTLNIRSYVAGHLTISLWPNNTIPYVFDHSFSDWQMEAINESIALLNNSTCVTFVPVTFEEIDEGNHENYVEFSYYPKTMYDGYNVEFYGFKPGRTLLDFGDQSFGRYGNLKLVLWKLMALLGMTPEHRRPDREKNIWINWENVAYGADAAFSVFRPYDLRMLWTTYDLRSIMHPTPMAFSKMPFRKVTMMSQQLSRHHLMGSAKTPTKSDYAKINNFYCYGRFGEVEAVSHISTGNKSSKESVLGWEDFNTDIYEYNTYYNE